jgi:hypothetical protein
MRPSHGDERLELLLNLAIKLADKANDSLSRVPDGGRDWQLLSCAIQPAVTFHHLQLSCLKEKDNAWSYNEILIHVQKAVEPLTREHGSSDFAVASKFCLSLVLPRLCRWLSFEGETLLAAQVAAWSTQSLRGTSTELDSWFQFTHSQANGIETNHSSEQREQQTQNKNAQQTTTAATRR